MKQSFLWEESWISWKWASEGTHPRSSAGSSPQEVWPQHRSVVDPERQRWPSVSMLGGSFSRSPQLAVPLLAPKQGRDTHGEPLGCLVERLITHMPHRVSVEIKCGNACQHPAQCWHPNDPRRTAGLILLSSPGEVEVTLRNYTQVSVPSWDNQSCSSEEIPAASRNSISLSSLPSPRHPHPTKGRARLSYETLLQSTGGETNPPCA